MKFILIFALLHFALSYFWCYFIGYFFKPRPKILAVILVALLSGPISISLLILLIMTTALGTVDGGMMDGGLFVFGGLFTLIYLVISFAGLLISSRSEMWSKASD